MIKVIFYFPDVSYHITIKYPGAVRGLTHQKSRPDRCQLVIDASGEDKEETLREYRSEKFTNWVITQVYPALKKPLTVKAVTLVKIPRIAFH